MERLTSLDYTTEDFEDGVSPESTPMKDYFRNKTIFLTGGTGFLGHLFVEKLLRTNVKSVYLLIRDKDGKSPKERVKELYSGVLFSNLRNKDPRYLEKVKTIIGDIDKIQFALSDEDLKDIHDNVQIVIHAAADVRFDQLLSKLIRVNVRGTRELLRIAENIKKLEVFAYISTAYSNSHRENVDEQFYPPHLDPEIMIRFIENIENRSLIDEIYILQQRIVHPWLNNYTYSKSLSEEVVRRYGSKLPICVIRPSIIISTHEDPIPAWSNNIYGLNGILVACGMGILRVLPTDESVNGDIVCADFVVNSTLAAVWSTYEESAKYDELNEIKLYKDPEIYHVTSFLDGPITWREIRRCMVHAFAQYPSKIMLWKHCLNMTTSTFLLKLFTIYYHVIPAYFFDFFLTITKKKKRLMPVYRKVQRFLMILKPFMNKDWRFTNYNMRRVLTRMSPEDKEFFPSDIKRLNWGSFSYEFTHGLKLYITLDPPNDIARARVKYRKFVIAHYLVLFLYYSLHSLVFYFILKYFGFFNYICNTTLGIYKFIQNPN